MAEAALAALRAEVAAVERRHALEGRAEAAPGDDGILPLGLGPVDAVLPGGGLARFAVHEAGGSAAGAFAAWVLRALAARVTAGEGHTVLWCLAEGGGSDLYGPGLAQAGIATDDLLLVRCRREADFLWAMEEGLKDPGVAAVVAEPWGAVDLTASRRLQLAAETGGTLGLILGRGGMTADGKGANGNAGGRLAPSALSSRWQVDAAPSAVRHRPARHRPAQYRPAWRLALLRCRALTVAEGLAWTVVGNDETGDLAVAAAAGDRSAATDEAAGLRRRAG